MLAAARGFRPRAARMSSDSSVPRPPDRRSQTAPRETRRAADIDGDEDDAPDGPNGDAARSSERPLRALRDEGAQVVAFPKTSTHRRRRVEPSGREPSAPQPVDPIAEEPVERPKYLASELLKQDWYPRTPLAKTLRWGALGVGAAGAAGVLALGGASLGALLLAGVLAACAVAGVVPLAPTTRGVLLAVLATGGTALAGWMRMDETASAPLLVGCITISASALFFRAAHRASGLARALVAVGLAASAGWLALTGGVEALVVESLAWQAWVGPVLRLTLGLVIVSSLLTFLDPTGHGGAWGAGLALLVWLLADAAVSVAMGLWPVRAGAVDLSEPSWLATCAYPFLAAIGAGGLCQVWVLLSRPPTNGKREAPLTRATIA